MALLCVGDPHFKLENMEAAGRMAEFCVRECTQRGIRGVAVLGDLLHYHRKLHAQCMTKAIKFLRDLLDAGLEVVVIVGNHDMLSNQTYLDPEGHWLGALKHWKEHGSSFWVVDMPQEIEMVKSGVRVATCPYVPPGRLLEAMDSVLAPQWKERADLVLAHQELLGAKMGAMVSESGDVWEDDWPLLVSGHIHDRQWVGKRAYYPGSSMQHTISEAAHPKSVAVVLAPWRQDNVEEIPTEVFACAGVIRRDHATLVSGKGCRETLEELAVLQERGGIKPTLRATMGSREQAGEFRKTAAYRKLCGVSRVILDIEDTSPPVGSSASTGGGRVVTVTPELWQKGVLAELKGNERAQTLFRDCCRHH